MVDTSPSIFNFVRQKAQEGEQWAKLHAHLKHLETVNVDAEQQKVAEAKVEQAQLQEQLQQEHEVLETLLEAQKKAQETGMLLCLTHTYSGYPMVKQARQMVKEGVFGKIRKIYVEYPQGWLSRLSAGSAAGPYGRPLVAERGGPLLRVRAVVDGSPDPLGLVEHIGS